MKTKILIMAFLMSITAIMAGCGEKNKTSSDLSSDTTQLSESLADTSVTEQSESTTISQSTNAANTSISEDDAKNIALKDANVSESEVNGIRINQKIDDGISLYEVDFYVGNKEYEYEISAQDGSIRSKDTDIDNDFGSTAQNNADVSLDKAKKTALSKVKGATEKDIRIHSEYDDGRQIYEGSIVYKNMEYDFEIDSETGNIISWETESVFDD